MPFQDDQIEELKRCFPGVSVGEEGGAEYLLLPQCNLPEGCEPAVVDLLLCPTSRDGYPSRLFLAVKAKHRGKGQDWNPKGSVVILGREWWAVSWKIQPGNERLLSKVAAHLEAFKP